MLNDRFALKSKMAKIGINQTQLAHKLGISKSTLSKKMNSKLDFTMEEVNQMYFIFDLDAIEVVNIFFTLRVV